MPFSMPFPSVDTQDWNTFDGNNWNEDGKDMWKRMDVASNGDGVHFRTPSSSHDRGSPIDPIPSGGNSRAVDDVSRMVASLVS